MVSERGEARVTELESAILCAGILIGAALALLLVGVLAVLYHFASAIDGL